MPPAMMLPQMMVELAVYGLVAGLCEKYISQKNEMTKLYEFNYCDACRKNCEWFSQYMYS